VTRDAILALARGRRHGVQASVSPRGAPQAALVGFAMSDALEVVFDTVTSSRKYPNLVARPDAAFVVGADGDAWTLQLEGPVDEPSGDDLARLQAVYFATFTDGPARLKWPGIAYLRLRPAWIRLSDYRGGDAVITEWHGDALRRLVAGP
jgi:hypothetical protein